MGIKHRTKPRAEDAPTCNPFHDPFGVLRAAGLRSVRLVHEFVHGTLVDRWMDGSIDRPMRENLLDERDLPRANREGDRYLCKDIDEGGRWDAWSRGCSKRQETFPRAAHFPYQRGGRVDGLEGTEAGRKAVPMDTRRHHGRRVRRRILEARFRPHDADPRRWIGLGLRGACFERSSRTELPERRGEQPD